MGTVKTTANTPSEGEETVGKVGSILRHHTFFKSNIDTLLCVVGVGSGSGSGNHNFIDKWTYPL